jgi:hypothetical protein
LAPDDPFAPPGGAQAEQAGLPTVTEAVKQAGVSRATARGWITRGQPPAVRIDRRDHIRPADPATTEATAHLSGEVPTWRPDRRRAGQRLRALREAAGLSQLEFAAATAAE